MFHPATALVDAKRHPRPKGAALSCYFRLSNGMYDNGYYTEGKGNFTYAIPFAESKATLFRLSNGDEIWVINPQLLIGFADVQKLNLSIYEPSYSVPQSALLSIDTVRDMMTGNHDNVFFEALNGMRSGAKYYINPNVQTGIEMEEVMSVSLTEFTENISQYVKPEQYIAGFSSDHHRQFSANYNCCQSMIVSCWNVHSYSFSPKTYRIDSIYGETSSTLDDYGKYIFIIGCVNF